MTPKQRHLLWLNKMGLAPYQVKEKKQKLGNPNKFPDLKVDKSGLSNNIPSNGTKSPDTSKANFCNKNYAMMPAYNKGPIQPISMSEIKYAGKKM